ncbi:MAG: hypothetical protein HeimC2_28840 [Candidatus Heimdallarchaeota archaeon LC_2]|nr:MAG: hypothetical protein HeimC2_28840 [Candidatus Heimdallarchaeota archaeon LC_2]
MRTRNYILFLGTIGLILTLTLPTSAGVMHKEDFIWADGEIFDSIITPATFKAPNNLKSVDKLYVFMNLDGQRLVAEAAPYEKDYNGFRLIF